MFIDDNFRSAGMLGQGFWKRWWWLAAFIVFDVCFVIWWLGRDWPEVPTGNVASTDTQPVATASIEPSKPVIPPLMVGFPTAQTNLVRTTDETVFMPTASGRIESAFYGSTRTGSSGYASFHEGIDIAPLSRDRRGRALDPVLAIADGSVAYVNRHSGNSNYGIYVVLEHADPVGTIYSLYAHLQSVEKRLHKGMPVTRGTPLGIMGNTPASIVPIVRSHLHLEVGMIRNRRFDDWASAKKIDNRHGRYHGWNLSGINPLDLYTATDPVRPFSMRDYLGSLPVAFELLIDAPRPLEYFSRHHELWMGTQPATGPLVLSVSEGGVVMAGRPASESERERLSSARGPVVLAADAAVLGRNGLRLVVQRNGQWEFGRSGPQWLEILTF
jgi:murein DD-endopeptidase MepM/ murein hydrolase activator NlpD